MVPCHHICHLVSLCTLHLALSVPAPMKKTLSCAKWKLKGFGHRSFSVQAPLVWNSLPPHVRHSCFLSQFKTSLKTFLFTSAFSELPWFPRRFEIFPLIDCWCLCVYDLSVRARVTVGRRDGEGAGVGLGGRDWLRERVMVYIISCLLDIWTLPLYPPIPGFLKKIFTSLVSLFALF